MAQGALPIVLSSTADHSDDEEKFQSPFEKSPTWGMILEYCLNPKNFEREIKQMDIDFIIFRDKFPKAKLHAVIAPRKVVESIFSLEKKDIHMLTEMKARGAQIINTARAQGTISPTIAVRMGFHAVPQMRQLHMFVISQDFETIYIRKKEHWNAYTTEYFIDVDKIIAMLEKDGKVVVDQEHMMRVLYGSMHCPNCGTSLGNIGDVKRHIKTGCLERILPPKLKAKPSEPSSTQDVSRSGRKRSTSRECRRERDRSRSRSRSERVKHLYSSSSDSDSDSDRRKHRRRHYSSSSSLSSSSESCSGSDSDSDERGRHGRHGRHGSKRSRRSSNERRRHTRHH